MAWPRRVAALLALVGAAGVLLGSAAVPAAAVPRAPSWLSIDANAGASFGDAVADCLDRLRAAGGVAREVVEGADGARTRIVLREGAGSRSQPIVDGTTGERAVLVTWNPRLRRPYRWDGIRRIPCASLLHELQHAWDFDLGIIGAGSAHDHAVAEQRAIRAENWYRWRLRKPQRFFVTPEVGGVPFPVPLPAWVNWPEANPPVPFVGRPVRVEIRVGGRRLVGRYPRLVVLEVVNKAPEIVFVQGRTVDQELNCGGSNPVFRAEGLPRSCQLRVPIYIPPFYNLPDRNPFEVPLITLRGIVDPAGAGLDAEVVWRVKRKRLGCGGNAYDHFCQVALGTRGDYRTRLARPRSVTVVVSVEGGGGTAA